jgi:hypothetical protein
LLDRVQEGIHLRRFAFRYQFDPTIAQIANKAGNTVALGQAVCGVAKAYPLHVPGVPHVLANAMARFRSHSVHPKAIITAQWLTGDGGAFGWNGYANGPVGGGFAKFSKFRSDICKIYNRWERCGTVSLVVGNSFAV